MTTFLCLFIAGPANDNRLYVLLLLSDRIMQADKTTKIGGATSYY